MEGLITTHYNSTTQMKPHKYIIGLDDINPLQVEVFIWVIGSVLDGVIQVDVFIRVIVSVLDGCHSIQLYFRSVIFRMRVATGHTRVGFSPFG